MSEPGSTGPEADRPEPHPGSEGALCDHDTRPASHEEAVFLEGSGDPADEILAARLEQHLEAAASGQTPPHLPEEAGELSSLAHVLRLDRLAQSLAADAPTLDSAGPGRPPFPQQIGKYEVRRLLGSGGQARTWLAFDPDLRRHVVIKLYHNVGSATDGEAVLQEGRALARVHSPYVARCYGADRLADGTPYLVMEYIAGQPLNELAGRRSFTPGQAVSLVAEVAEGLAAVHACGLLHRDLKPSNILVGDDGVPRLVDFGLAKAVGAVEPGQVSGTPQYMAPEQARGETERIDARSDLFGLGAVLYWLLADRAPFEAPGVMDAWKLACSGEVRPLEQLNSRIPAWIRDLCMRCLAPAPEQRFESATELARAIRQHQRRAKRRQAALAAAAVLLAAAGTVLVVLPRWPRDGSGSPAVATTSGTEPAHSGGSGEFASVVALPENLLNPGRPLRRDFGLEVRVLGRPLGAEEELVLAVGEAITLTILADRDCCARVWWVDPNEEVTQIFPNRYEPEDVVRAGRPRTIPGNDRYALRATPSAGREHFYVLASTRPWEPVPAAASGPYLVFRSGGQLQRWQNQLRGILIEPKSDQAQVAELIIPFRVQPPGKKAEPQ